MIGRAVIAVVVPARDEERWIGGVLDTLPSFVDHAIVVDDGSRDHTRQHVEQRSVDRDRAGPVVWVTSHPTPRGVGAALVTGYRWALRCGADVVAVMAGDGQMAPDDLRRVVEPVAAGAADYVKGNRLAHPEAWRRMPAGRLVGTAVLGALTSWVVGVPLHDGQCGYTAIHRRALVQLDLESLWPGFGYPNDLVGLLAAAGCRITEVPVAPVYRGESSRLRVWHLAVIGGLLARMGGRRLGRLLRARTRA